MDLSWNLGMLSQDLLLNPDILFLYWPLQCQLICDTHTPCPDAEVRAFQPTLRLLELTLPWPASLLVCRRLCSLLEAATETIRDENSGILGEGGRWEIRIGQKETSDNNVDQQSCGQPSGNPGVPMAQQSSPRGAKELELLSFCLTQSLAQDGVIFSKGTLEQSQPWVADSRRLSAHCTT